MADKLSPRFIVPAESASEIEAILNSFGKVNREPARSVGVAEITAIVTLVGASATLLQKLMVLIKAVRSWKSTTGSKRAPIRVEAKAHVLDITTDLSDREIEAWIGEL